MRFIYFLHPAIVGVMLISHGAWPERGTFIAHEIIIKLIYRKGLHSSLVCFKQNIYFKNVYLHQQWQRFTIKHAVS